MGAQAVERLTFDVVADALPAVVSERSVVRKGFTEELIRRILQIPAMLNGFDFDDRAEQIRSRFGVISLDKISLPGFDDALDTLSCPIQNLEKMISDKGAIDWNLRSEIECAVNTTRQVLLRDEDENDGDENDGGDEDDFHCELGTRAQRMCFLRMARRLDRMCLESAIKGQVFACTTARTPERVARCIAAGLHMYSNASALDSVDLSEIARWMREDQYISYYGDTLCCEMLQSVRRLVSACRCPQCGLRADEPDVSQGSLASHLHVPMQYTRAVRNLESQGFYFCNQRCLKAWAFEGKICACGSTSFSTWQCPRRRMTGYSCDDCQEPFGFPTDTPAP